VTHTHLDHWDNAARDYLPKGMLLFVQDEKDAAAILAAGFSDVRVLSTDTDFDGVALTKTPGQHGSDEAMQKIGGWLGTVCGGWSSGTPTRRPCTSPGTPSGTGTSRRASGSTRPTSSS